MADGMAKWAEAWAWNRGKRFVEQVAFDKVWLEPAQDTRAVAEFIKGLRPVVTTRELRRFGNSGDGGYLLPDDLDGIRACVSPGVSTEVGFDLAMANHGLHVFMADASVDGPPMNHERFTFFKKFLGVQDDETTMRMDALCGAIPSKLAGDKLLQMDIEGAEYSVLLDTSDAVLQEFRIMVIEFHRLSRVFSRIGFDLISSTFRKLQRYHNIVHVHPNNAAGATYRGNLQIPDVMEFTFYRKDRANIVQGLSPVLPNPLDVDNVDRKPTLNLANCWR